MTCFSLIMDGPTVFGKPSPSERNIRTHMCTDSELTCAMQYIYADDCHRRKQLVGIYDIYAPCPILSTFTYL
jgi:hypothetical protein